MYFLKRVSLLFFRSLLSLGDLSAWQLSLFVYITRIVETRQQGNSINVETVCDIRGTLWIYCWIQIRLVKIAQTCHVIGWI
jgi:hypothetical protein